MHIRANSLVCSFFLSLALHLSLFFLWPRATQQEKGGETIPVALLPSPDEQEVKALPKPGRLPMQPQAAPQVAKRSSPPPEEPDSRAPEPSERAEPGPEYERVEEREKNTIVRAPVITREELLPPGIWTSTGEQKAVTARAIPLNTREPKYVTYLDIVKRAINLVWVYPEPALRNGLEGKLVVEFTILANGQLDEIRLIRSSGFSILDEEAIRAIQAASPFRPLPLSIGRRLDITASVEYIDNRIKYIPVP